MPSRAWGSAAAGRPAGRARAGLAGARLPAGRAWLAGASVLAGAVGGLTSLAYLALLDGAKLLLWPGRVPVLAHCLLLAGTGGVISVLLAVLGDPGPTGVLVKSIHLDGGPRVLRSLRSLVPVSLLGIAVGGGIGPEPVLMQVTATVSAWIGRRLRVPPDGLRVLTVTGLASGLTILFAAPLGGAVFGLEILHRKGLEYYEALLPACAGSLASYAVYAAITGRGLAPTWQVPGVQPHLELADLLTGALGGVAGAGVAHLFDLMLKACAGAAARLPPWARPPAAGFALAALSLAAPSGLTYGESQLTALVALPAVAVTGLLLAAAGHLVSAAITLAGRWKGGIIIPMFITGYCLGRAIAESSGHGGHYLVLAASMMVACNAGMTKTPLGSALVVSEMTGLTLVPPLVIAALVSLCLTSRVSFVGSQRHREHFPGQPASHPAAGTPRATASQATAAASSHDQAPDGQDHAPARTRMPTSPPPQGKRGQDPSCQGIPGQPGATSPAPPPAHQTDGSTGRQRPAK